MILTFCGRSVNVLIYINILMRRSIRRGERGMKAKIDKGQRGEIRVKGVRMEIGGRIKGATRARKKVIIVGKQNQQDR